MRGVWSTIKEKSRNRLSALEHKRPTHTGGSGIQITQEAQDMLQPWREALERLDGQILHYKDTPSPGCIYLNRHDFNRTIVITEAVWFKALGDALAQSTEDRRIVDVESGNAFQSEPVVLDAITAQKAIDTLKVYGVTV